MYRSALCCLILLAFATASHAISIETKSLDIEDGPTMTYTIVAPDDFDPRETYPVLLALPPGGQDENMVNEAIRRYWGEPATSRGWVVVVPAAPDGKLFHEGSTGYLVDLMNMVDKEFYIEGGRVHLAGISNGGKSAFRIATMFPERIQSLTVFPGYPPDWDDTSRLKLLRGIPVTMWSGELDHEWTHEMNRATAELQKANVDVRYTTLPGEGHVPESLTADHAMSVIDALRSRESVDVREKSKANNVLDLLHIRAAHGDLVGYMELFASDATFIGTDPDEVWSVADLRAYAKKHFTPDGGWRYTSTNRTLTLGPEHQMAWFQETLANERLGTCRGSGVLRKVEGEWRIAQYVLTIPIPNETADTIVKTIRTSDSQ